MIQLKSVWKREHDFICFLPGKRKLNIVDAFLGGEQRRLTSLEKHWGKQKPFTGALRVTGNLNSIRDRQRLFRIGCICKSHIGHRSAGENGGDSLRNGLNLNRLILVL